LLRFGHNHLLGCGLADVDTHRTYTGPSPGTGTCTGPSPGTYTCPGTGTYTGPSPGTYTCPGTGTYTGPESSSDRPESGRLGVFRQL
jgi:hypothetical protein